MAKVADRLDTIVDKIMSGLKDFQQATVERIDYLYRHNQRRVLVSDEELVVQQTEYVLYVGLNFN